VVSFRKINYIHLDVDGKHFIEPGDIVGIFSKHLQSVYNNPCPVAFPTLSSPFKSLSLALDSDSDIFKATKRLRPSKSAGVYDSPGYIIKSCTYIVTCFRAAGA
jgi:hypothetical protein